MRKMAENKKKETKSKGHEEKDVKKRQRKRMAKRDKEEGVE